MDTSQRVAVVGAGFAGLAAALDLDERGLGVTVVEARDRVGGRVWTQRLPDGTPVELGAEWVMPGDDALAELCRRLGLGLAEVGVDYRRRVPAGGAASTLEEQDALLAEAREARARLADAEALELSVAAFLGSLPAGERARATLRARLQGTCAVDLDTVPLGATDADAFDSTPETYRRVTGGNQSVAVTAASRLPDVRLGHRVATIEQSERGVVVRGSSSGAGWTLDADAAVVAVPARLVGEMAFVPSLPEDQSRAFAELPMGVAAKLAIATAGEPPLLSVQCADLPMWCWTGNGAGGARRPCLTSFAGSPEAQRALRAESGDPSTWLARIRDLIPGVELTGRPLMKSWGDDELARGSYSSVDRRSFNRAKALARPFGRVVFAGEHTGIPVEFATMNAAIASGRRAANDVNVILEALLYDAARPRRPL